MDKQTDLINEQLAALEVLVANLTMLGCVVEVEVQFPLEYAPLTVVQNAK